MAFVVFAVSAYVGAGSALVPGSANGDETQLWRALAVGAPALAVLATLAAFAGLYPYRACVAANAGAALATAA
ncbi:hypothetical protein MKK75_27370 [Methylobacterium sp. J-030]|uniref:hypothetical protein n=1 Tax=Methylobacterium sp. J-030 TaxID=2836627 RepID=UPI001FB9B5A0|nr:hypothetical protein [Methylobacterium sp. J-030]MCJ2072467.1 hypothetical protein [Methylobacterium sp. J-030]